MTTSRLFPMAILVVTLLALHALPFLPRRGRLFGVAVPPGVRNGSEGSRLLRGYQFLLLPWTLAALLIELWIPAGWASAGLALAPIVPLVAANRLWQRGRTEARRFALPASSVREAQLSDAGEGLGRRWWWFLPPFAMLGAVALYLCARWDQIPQRFAIHWDFNGHPNGWSNRSAGGVFGPPILGALVVTFLVALAELTYRYSRRTTQRSPVFAVFAVVAYLIASVFSLAGLSPFWTPSPWALLGLLAGFLAIVAIAIARAYSRPEPENEPGETVPEECWHAGEFYYNPDDPALFVEKRVGIGYTFNFANPVSWAILGGTVLFFAGIVLLASRLMGGHR
jgi:uncharacterized membrane protein